MRRCPRWDLSWFRYVPSGTGLPALATDPVAVAGPAGAVLATGAVGVLDVALAIGPERVVVAVVSASRAAGKGLALAHAGHLARGSDGRDGRRGGEEERGEGNHCEICEIRLEVMVEW